MGDYHSYSNILSLDEDRSNLSLSALNLLTGTRHVDCCIYILEIKVSSLDTYLHT